MAGDFGTPSEYVRELIRRDQERRLTRLEAEPANAQRSGDIELRPEEWKNAPLVTVLRKKLRGAKRKRV